VHIATNLRSEVVSICVAKRVDARRPILRSNLAADVTVAIVEALGTAFLLRHGGPLIIKRPWWRLNRSTKHRSTQLRERRTRIQYC